MGLGETFRIPFCLSILSRERGCGAGPGVMVMERTAMAIIVVLVTLDDGGRCGCADAGGAGCCLTGTVAENMTEGELSLAFLASIKFQCS